MNSLRTAHVSGTGTKSPSNAQGRIAGEDCAPAHPDQRGPGAVDEALGDNGQGCGVMAEDSLPGEIGSRTGGAGRPEEDTFPANETFVVVIALGAFGL